MNDFRRSTFTPKDVSERIADEPGMLSILKLGTQDHIAYSDERIGEIAAGCIQWLAVAFTLPKETELLMFHGQVEQFLRIILTDTLLYEIICREYSGGPVRYKPILRTDIGLSHATTEQTLGLLRAAFGDDLHPELMHWENLNKRRLLVPAGFIRR